MSEPAEQIIDQDETQIRPVLRQLLEQLGAVAPDQPGDVVAILDLDRVASA